MKFNNSILLTLVSLCAITAYGMEKETAKKNEKQHGNNTKNLTLKEPKTQPLEEQYDGTDTLSDDDLSLQYKRLISYSKDPKNKFKIQ